MCTISKMKLSDKFGSSLVVLLLVCIDFQLLVEVKIKRRFSEIKRRFARVKCRFIFVKRRFGLAKQKNVFFEPAFRCFEKMSYICNFRRKMNCLTKTDKRICLPE